MHGGSSSSSASTSDLGGGSSNTSSSDIGVGISNSSSSGSSSNAGVSFHARRLEYDRALRNGDEEEIVRARLSLHAEGWAIIEESLRDQLDEQSELNSETIGSQVFRSWSDSVEENGRAERSESNFLTRGMNDFAHRARIDERWYRNRTGIAANRAAADVDFREPDFFLGRDPTAARRATDAIDRERRLEAFGRALGEASAASSGSTSPTSSDSTSYSSYVARFTGPWNNSTSWFRGRHWTSARAIEFESDVREYNRESAELIHCFRNIGYTRQEAIREASVEQALRAPALRASIRRRTRSRSVSRSRRNDQAQHSEIQSTDPGAPHRSSRASSTDLHEFRRIRAQFQAHASSSST